MTLRRPIRVVVLTILALTGIVCWAAERDQPQPTSRPTAPATRPTTAPAAHAGDLPAAGPPTADLGKDGKWSSYEAMHQYFVNRFVESNGFGFERMMTPRMMARSNVLYMEGEHFRIGTVELISLGGGKDAKGADATPFVYKTPHLDAMKMTIGSKAEHRPLKDVEAEALAKLRAGRQSVLAGDNDHPTLVGAVRATSDCLKCHEVKDGELLGAFSYPLVPVKPAADEDAPPPPPAPPPHELR